MISDRGIGVMRPSPVIPVLLALAAMDSLPVNAADFRGLDFGSSCKQVQELEKARGSVQVPWTNVEYGDLIAFKGRAFERDVSIVYLCVNGQLLTARYFFALETFDGAAKSYGEVHGRLMDAYGPPFLDTSPWSNVTDVEQDMRSARSDPAKYVSAWKTSRIRLSLSLMPRAESPDTTWQVFVMVSANKS